MERIVAAVDRFQRRHVWLAFPFGVLKKFGEDQAGNLAALIAYWSFFSLFPLLLAMVGVLGFFLGRNAELQRRALEWALAHFPLLGDDIRDNLGSLRGRGVALAFGFGLAIWAGMRAVQATREAMNSIWDVPMRTRAGFFPARLRVLGVLLLVGAAVVATAALSALPRWIGLASTVGVWRPVLSVAVYVVLFLILFRVLTDRACSWSELLPGALVAAVATYLLQVLGGVYVGRTVRGASRTYGAFAVVIGLLSWIHLQAQVILFAAEFNVVRARRLWPRSLTNDDLTEADRQALTQHAQVEERLPAEDVRVVAPGENHERGVNRPEVRAAPIPPSERRP